VSVQPPAPLDVEALLSTLERHRVDYVLIGGVAARLHGSPLLTEDIDVTPATDRENLRRLAAALRELDARLRVPGEEPVEIEFDERSFGSCTTMTLTTRFGFLDLCFRPDGTKGYRDLEASAVTYELFGLKVAVAALADLIRSKVAAGRNKDLQALPTLRALEERLAP
jgi:hypothetical protein